MIDPNYARMMARYNHWQNRSLLQAASGLGDAERRMDCGAFFGSIENTIRHLLWADQIWLSRFTAHPAPIGRFMEATAQHVGFAALRAAREAMDQSLLAWAEQLDPAWLAGDVTWTSALSGRRATRPAWIVVAHMFNHQTHHRGQIHALLTRFGAAPEDTDLILLPPDSPQDWPQD